MSTAASWCRRTRLVFNRKMRQKRLNRKRAHVKWITNTVKPNDASPRCLQTLSLESSKWLAQTQSRSEINCGAVARFAHLHLNNIKRKGIEWQVRLRLLPNTEHVNIKI